MKKLFAVLSLLVLFAVTLPGQAAIGEAPQTFYKAGEFGLSLGADVTSPDLENGRLGYSGAIRYYLTENWGIGIGATSQRLDEDYRVSPLLLFRLPFNRAALLTEAGADYDIENDQWALRVGVGPAYRWTENLETSLTLGARKYFGTGPREQTIEAVVTAQVSIYFGGK